MIREKDGQVQNGTLTVKRAGGVPPPQDFAKTITALDAGLFAAYNACELAKFRSYFATGVEFYHDKGGLMNSVDAIVEATRKNV